MNEHLLNNADLVIDELVPLSDNEMLAEFEVAKEDTTCWDCPLNKDCLFAWDSYNTGGDCLANK